MLPPEEAELQDDILPVHVAEVAQGVPEHFPGPFRTLDAHNPDPWDFPRQLGVGSQRRHQEAECQGHEPPRDVRPHSCLLGAACCPLPCRSWPARMGSGCAHATRVLCDMLALKRPRASWQAGIVSYIRCCKQPAVCAEGHICDRGAQHCSDSPKNQSAITAQSWLT